MNFHCLVRQENKLMSSLLVSSVLALALVGCGGGGGGGGGPTGPTVRTGVFVDSAVEGVSYATATQSGTTNANGEFSYVDGETVAFSIGAVELPPATAAPTITPVTLAGATDITNQEATNIARLLQSLDSNGIPSDGITIPAATVTAATAAINFNQTPAAFTSDSAVGNLISATTSTLIDETTAQTHVTTTLNDLAAGVQGVWQLDADSLLVLFTDGTFFYGEAGGVEPNGMELGSYVYDPSSSKITFTVTTDLNGSGGISDGTSSVVPMDVIVTASTITVILPDGDVTLTKVTESATGLPGVWRTTDQCCVMALSSGGMFMYGELDAQAPNGLEAGTYTTSAGSITFNLGYDDNGPGTDSGVGDIGTPKIADYTLTNSNNTFGLTGLITFDREY